MNVPGSELLAGARLAKDQHIGVKRGYLLDQPLHLAHRSRLPTGTIAHAWNCCFYVSTFGLDQAGDSFPRRSSRQTGFYGHFWSFISNPLTLFIQDRKRGV